MPNLLKILPAVGYIKKCYFCLAFFYNAIAKFRRPVDKYYSYYRN